MSRRFLDEAVLRKLYIDDFLSTTEIARRYGYSRDGILWRIKKFGIPLRRYKVKGLDITNLQILYVERKWSTIKIAKHLKCNDESVRQQLIKHGVPIRTKTEAGRVKIMTPEHLAKLREGARKINLGKIGDKNHNWKGGRYTDNYGYIILRVDKKYIKEHRYVIEKANGKPLLPWEEVHHINGIKTDNRIENLEVIHSEHKHKDWLRQHES